MPDFEHNFVLEDGTIYKARGQAGQEAARFKAFYTPVKDRATLNQNLALRNSPDEEAEILNLSQKTGWTTDLVRSQKTQAKEQSHKIDFEAIDNAALLGFIAKSPNNAALVKDDYPPLKKAVGTLDRIQNYGGKLADDVSTAFQTGETNVELGHLYYNKFINGLEVDDARIKTLEESLVRPERKDLFGKIATATAEQLPLLGATITGGLEEATKGLIIGGGLGLLGGPATAVPGVLLGAKAGFAFGAAEEIFTLEAGNAAKEYSEFVDEDGNKLDPETIKYAAMTAGFLNASLEFVGDVALLKTLPGMNRLATVGARQVVKDALKKKSFRAAVKRIALSFGGALAIEPITEMAQEAITVDIGEITKRIKLPEAEEIEAQTKRQRVLEAGKQALLATTGIAGAGSTVRIAGAAVKKGARIAKARSVKERPKQFYEDQVELSKALAETKTKERSQAKTQELLEDGGLTQDVLVEGSEAQKFYQTEDNSKIFSKLGITEEEIQKAAITGQTIPIKLSEIQSILTLEESERFLKIVKETSESLSFEDSQTINVNEELTRINEIVDEIGKEESEFLKEKDRVEAEVLEVARIRKLKNPKQHAKGLAEIWGAFSQRMAEEGGQDAATTLKRIRTEAATFQDIKEAEEFAEVNGLENVIPLGVTKVSPEGFVIKLFENANPSTLLHETGHVFFNEVLSLINLEKASESLVKDFDTVKEWLEVDPEVGITLKQQDKFAQAFELYLREGKAPSKGLTSFFERFKKWLTSVYQTVKGTAIDVNLNDDVRAVFDRLLAADQEVKQFVEQNEFVVSEETLSDLQLSEDDKLLFRRLMKGMTATAKQQVQQRLAKEHKANIKDWTQEAAVEVAGKRVNNLFVDLTSSKRGFSLAASSEFLSAKQLAALDKKFTDIFAFEGMDPKIMADRFGYESVDSMFQALADPLPSKENEGAFNKANELRSFLSKPVLGLNQTELEFEFGKQMAIRLKAKNPRLVRPDGQSLANITLEYGYDSVTEMVQDLETVPPRKEQVKDIVSQKEREHYLNFTASDAFLNWNDDLEKYFDVMGKFIKKRSGVEISISQKEYKDQVEAEFAVLPVEKATRTDWHLSAMRRALRNRDKAIRSGDFQDASKFHEQSRLNYEFARKSNQARERVRKTKKLTQKASKTKGKIEFDYWKNIVSLGNKFSLRSGKEPQNITPFQNLLDKQESLLDSGVKFRPWIENSRPTNFRKLTVNQFEELSVLIEVLNHIGRKLVADTTVLSEAKLETVKESLIEVSSALPRKASWDSRSVFGKLDNFVKSALSDINSLYNILVNLDGFTELGPKGKEGPWVKSIYNNLTKADSEFLRINADLREKISLSLDQLNKSLRANAKIVSEITVPVPDILKLHNKNWYFDTIISIALNMGNRQNIDAIKQGYGLTESDLIKILEPLSKEDWRAIQNIGDAIGSYRDQLFATKKRIDGFEPPMVEPDVFVTPKGQTLRGWYYPLRRDLNLIPHEKKIGENLAETERSAVSPIVTAGSLMERKGFGGNPVKLDLAVLAQHINFISMYISHAEVLKDTSKIINDPNVSNLIIEKLGLPALESLKSSLRNIAHNNHEDLMSMDKFFEKLRGLSTVYLLGANVSVAIKQVFSLSNFISEFGIKTYIPGVIETTKASLTGKFGDLKENVHKMSPFMSARGNNLDVSINEAIQKDLLEKPIPFAFGLKKSQVRDAMFILIRGADFMTTFPAWVGAFNKGKEQFNGDIDKAVSFADKAIRTTQPSFRPIDLSPIQNSRKGVARAFTMFSTYTLLFGRRQRTYFKAWKQGKISSSSFFRAVMWEGLVAPVTMNLTFAALRGEAPDPEDLAADIFTYNLIGIPLVKDFAVILSNIARDKPYGREWDSPLFTPFELGTRVMNFITQWIKDLESDKKWRNAVLAMAELLSFGAGVPAPRVGRKIVKGMEQWERGEGTPFNVLVPQTTSKK